MRTGRIRNRLLAAEREEPSHRSAGFEADDRSSNMSVDSSSRSINSIANLSINSFTSQQFGSSLSLSGKQQHSSGSSTEQHQQLDPTETPSRHGAYNVVKIRPAGNITYEIDVPDEYTAGETMEVDGLSNNRTVYVTLPEDYEAGTPMEITLPLNSVTTYQPLKLSLLTASPSAEEAWRKRPNNCPSKKKSKNARTMIWGAVPVPQNCAIRAMNQAALEAGRSVAKTHIIKIPANTEPGQSFSVTVDGVTFQATCPPGTAPGQRIRIVPPPPQPEMAKRSQLFEIIIPKGVQPGDHFAATIAMAGSSKDLHILVECPQGRATGDTMSVQLPTQTVVSGIKLTYNDKKNPKCAKSKNLMSGWRRTIRASDLAFQWVRTNKKTAKVLDSLERFDFTKSAYVRQLLHLEGHDPRLPTGSLRLVPANQAHAPSKYVAAGQTLFSYADLAEQRAKPLQEKHEWFLDVLQKLTELQTEVPPNLLEGETLSDAYMELFVRREHLLNDSLRAVLSLSPGQMQAKWRVRFWGEEALDDGGLSKEWFHLLTETLLDPATGLFAGRNEENQAVVDIFPGAGE